MSSSEKDFDDLSNWMTSLPSYIRDMPLIHLAIPGTHDSMTYGITRKSEASPDADPNIKKLSIFCHSTVRRWAITQEYDVQEQLHQGIRYFDFRIATKKPSSDFYFVHGLYADEVSSSLVKIRDFLDTHPGEVVIIDCQHFYDFSRNDHFLFSNMLYEAFTYRICPSSGSIKKCTLNALKQNREQLIIIYRGMTGHKYFWPTYVWNNPWPDEITVSGLLDKLKFGLENREVDVGYVSQCLLTPTPKFIALRWHSNLKNKCAKPVAKNLFPWIKQLEPGCPNGRDLRVNVILADFVEINESNFSKLVVDLNKKLMKLAE
ncbi:PI-PLC X domain-containing protein 2 [Ctenocephalides felis]|uniref:PI-PLC X domain-containing protein 2 n=1 Tax=Ctenocephalides felis TaxID=7515 RepID=UPI000E6E59BA|nr:PI-PLC X domain-containing protein 2 [Ctenocephalides felis]